MPSHHQPPRPTMLPKFADTTTTIIYCVHCRCSSSSSSSSSSSACIISDEATETESTNRLLLCSRCKVVHYCSKECQKLNYQFHKKRCQLIHKLRNDIIIIENMTKKKNEDEENIELKVEVEEEVDVVKQLRYELSYIIFELGYMSTDTIERGKYIYQCSLSEYYKLLQIDFSATGVFESILLLLSILDDRNYDNYCISSIKYVLYDTNDNNNNDNSNNLKKIYNNELLCWDYGDITTSSSSTFEISDYKKFRNLLAIRRHHSNNTNPNILFVPLMIIKMRQYADMTNSNTHHVHDDQLLDLKKEIAELCYHIEIEYETNYSSDNDTGGNNCTTENKLPVMKALFPDSNQYWGEEEAQMLLANKSRRVTTTTNDNEWEKCCFIYWMLMKDCYAYTPGLLDVVEEIIIYMEESESKEGYTGRSVIRDDDKVNNDNGNDPSSESDDSEYISFINSMSSTAQELQHKQQQQQQKEEEEEDEVGL